MSLAADYGRPHRLDLIRAARLVTACTVALADRRRAEREQRAQEMAISGLGELLAALATRDPAAHDHLLQLLATVETRRAPIQALQAAAHRYAIALLEEDEGAQ